MSKEYFIINKEKVIIFVILVAFLLRVFVLVNYGLDITLNSDDMGYVHSAINLIKTGMLTYMYKTEPTVLIMPAYPMLLAGVFLIFDYTEIGLYAAKFIMIIIGILGIYGIYLLGKYLYNIESGLIAALILTFSFSQILTDNLLLTETPFMTSFIYLVYFSVKLPNTKRMNDFYLYDYAVNSA